MPSVLGQAVDYVEIKQAFDQQRYEPARLGFLQLAEQGDPRAMFYLGVIHNQGLGTATDLKQAFAWYEKSAKLGHAVAQYNLGNAFKHGRGTDKSEALAVFWWEKAAQQGQANAQYNLALQYYLGMGVDKDPDKALFYFQEAASRGHPKAVALIAEGKVPARKGPPTPPGSEAQASAPATALVPSPPPSAPASPSAPSTALVADDGKASGGSPPPGTMASSRADDRNSVKAQTSPVAQVASRPPSVVAPGSGRPPSTSSPPALSDWTPVREVKPVDVFGVGGGSGAVPSALTGIPLSRQAGGAPEGLGAAPRSTAEPLRVVDARPGFSPARAPLEQKAPDRIPEPPAGEADLPRAGTVQANRPAPLPLDQQSQAGPRPFKLPPMEQTPVLAAPPAPPSSPKAVVSDPPRSAANAHLVADDQAAPAPPSVPVGRRSNPDSAAPAGGQPLATPAEQVAAAPPVASPDPSAAATTAVVDRSWLAAQQPSDCTIQLAVMSNIAYLERFLNSYNLRGKVKVLAIAAGQQKRYHVLLGNYPDLATAESRIGSLDPGLRLLKPWARCYAALSAIAGQL